MLLSNSEKHTQPCLPATGEKLLLKSSNEFEIRYLYYDYKAFQLHEVAER